MVLLQATKHPLPKSPSSSLCLSSRQISSLLFHPPSLSLALMHSDSSFSLYPSYSLSSSLSFPQTFIPSPSSSATFLLLQNPNPNPNHNSDPNPNSTVFLVAAPHNAGAAVLLRFWVLSKSQSFARAKVICNQSGLRFDDRKLGVVFDVSHGVSVRVSGSINVFAMYSVSNCKVWVFGVKMVEGGVGLKLMKCAVIDCCVPVSAISVSFGVLILGEENGVRVFPLRPLVKGRVTKKAKNLNGGVNGERNVGQRSSLPNGVIGKVSGSDELCGGNAENLVNGYTDGRMKKKHRAKPRSMKLKQDCKEGGICFVSFRSKEVESLNSTKPLNSAKAISIEALSSTKFMILDSVGNLHLLCLSSPALGPESLCHMNCLTSTMEVQKMAALSDSSTTTETIWLSNGDHTVHMMTLPDIDTSVNESDTEDKEEKLMQSSVTQAIFTSEKIQDIVPFAANAILVLGQGNIFAYTFS